MNLSHTPRTNILDFDVIIVGVGIWEVLKENKCQINGKLDRCGCILDLLLTCLEFTHQTGVPIVWRTSGYYDYDHVDEIQQQKQGIGSMSNVSMDFIDSLAHESGMTYINWGGAIYERSFGTDRIVGDMEAYYGVEPRFVFMHMLTNHLVEQGIFEFSS